LVLVALIGGEIILQTTKDYEACIEVRNKGNEPIEDLVASLGTHRIAAPKLAPGASTIFFLGGKGALSLQIDFRQRGNAMTSYQVPGVDPAMMTGEGSKLVIEIETNQVVKYQDESAPSTPVGRYARSLWKRTWAALEEGY
jgi:hypothetical protein